MSRRDERPYWHDELSIPWDEWQFASYLASEGAVDQRVAGYRGTPRRRWVPTLFSRIAGDDEVAEMAARFARPASARLRRRR